MYNRVEGKGNEQKSKSLLFKWAEIWQRKVYEEFFIIYSAYCSSLFRVDPDCISPDVKNSIHVGDKILEINGTPIHSVPLDEVFTTLSHSLLWKYFSLL